MKRVKMNSAKKALIGVVLGMGLLGPLPLHGQSWWNDHWSVRRAVIIEPEPGGTRDKIKGPPREGGYVTLLTGGQCNPDGSDIRVTGLDGRPVKFTILSMGPGDLVRVAFDARGTTRQRFFVYYGNAKAEPEKTDFRPRGGLLLETWNYAGGPIGTAEAIKSTVETAQASPPLGRTYLSSVFVGDTLFGPERSRTCNLYSGLLQCRQGGSYTFVISTFDAAALFIDDKPVVEWPGRHGWVGDIRHQGKVDLKPGPHKFALYQADLGGHGGAVAAWMPPGTSVVRVLEAEHFLPIGRGQLGPLEKRHKEVVADFTLEQKAAADMEAQGVTTPLYQYLFSAVKLPGGREEDYQWDFGDGQTATGTAVEHVFFREGLATVTLRVKKAGHEDNTTNRVHIGLNRLNPRANAERLVKFEPVVSSYQFARLSPADALTVMDYFSIIERPEKAIQVGRSVSRGAMAQPGQDDASVACARRTADLIIDRRGDYSDAADVLARTLRRLTPASGAYRQLAGRTASLYVDGLGDDKAAETILRSCPGQTTQPAPNMDKALLLAWGDLARFRGGRDRAEAFYKQAKTADASQEASRAGGYVTAVEDYLRRKEFTEARTLIDRWQWEEPTERLGGYSCLLRYRLDVAQGHYTQARLLAKVIQGIDPFGFYARQIAKEAAQ